MKKENARECVSSLVVHFANRPLDLTELAFLHRESNRLSLYKKYSLNIIQCVCTEHSLFGHQASIHFSPNTLVEFH